MVLEISQLSLSPTPLHVIDASLAHLQLIVVVILVGDIQTPVLAIASAERQSLL